MHCLECVKGAYFGEPEIMTDKLFAFTLSFHMPVFMMVSGYFATTLINKDISYIFKSRVLPIIFPLIFWCGISSIWHPTWYSNLVLGWEYWFLNCILIIYCLFFLVRFVPARYEDVVCVLLGALIMCFGTFNYCYVSSMFPFFVLGFLLRKHYVLFKSYVEIICIVTGTSFILMSLFWDINWTCYRLPIDLLENTWIENAKIFYRLIIGAVGALFIFSLLHIIYEKVEKLRFIKIVNWLGRHTLAIYLIHYFFYWIHALPKCSTGNILMDDFVIAPFYTMIVLAISMGVIKVLKLNPYLAYFSLGERIS